MDKDTYQVAFTNYTWDLIVWFLCIFTDEIWSSWRLLFLSYATWTMLIQEMPKKLVTYGHTLYHLATQFNAQWLQRKLWGYDDDDDEDDDDGGQTSVSNKEKEEEDKN